MKHFGLGLVALVGATTLTVNRHELAAAPVGIAPGDTVRPGDRRVSARQIAAHTNHWKMTYLTPDGRAVAGGPSRVASWFDTVSVQPLEGHPALHRHQVLLAPSEAVLETIDTWVDRQTFAPIETDSRYPATHAESFRHYAGRHVTGYDPDSAAANGRQPVDTLLPEPVFDFFGGSYDLLLSGFPLRAGYHATFPADFGGVTGGVALRWVNIKVVGREVIDAGQRLGRISTWHVATDSSPIGRFEFWISHHPPYMIRMMYIGPRGGRQIWDVA